jgi:predicted outer membrane repeat protein
MKNKSSDNISISSRHYKKHCKALFKFLFIILSLFINISLYSAPAGNWTTFKSLYENNTIADISLTNNIVFESQLLSLNHNITIDGANFFISGDNTFGGFNLDSKIMLLKNLKFKDFYAGSAAILWASNNSSITFTGIMSFDNNNINTTINTIFGIIANTHFDYTAIIDIRKSKFLFNNSTITFNNNASLNWLDNMLEQYTEISLKGGNISASEISSLTFINSSVSFLNNLNFTFLRNTINDRVHISILGGALYTSQSSISFSGSTIAFAYNGSFIVQDNSPINGPGSGLMPIPFAQPYAPGPLDPLIKDEKLIFYFSGGAMYIEKSTFNFKNSKANFYKNMSQDYGGAFFAEKSRIIFENALLLFSSNTTKEWNGGAVSIFNSSLNFNRSSINFSANMAGVYGGALYAYLSKIYLNQSSITFIKNSSNYGGGFLLAYSTLNFLNTVAVISSNTAEYGAGAELVTSSLIFNSSTITFNNNTSASNGAGINIEMFSNISFLNSKIIFTGNSSGLSLEFDANGAGGAIYLLYSIGKIERSSISLNSNFATWGGALAQKNSLLKVIYSSVFFSSNTAGTFGGGAIHLNKSTLTFENSVISFSSNSADSYGGAIYGENSLLEIKFSTVIFTRNISSDYGAALAHKKSLIRVIYSSIVFSNNTADTFGGGAIYLNKTALTFENSIISFSSNLVSSYGGAIYGENSLLEIKYSTAIFTRNTSGDYGGSIYLFKSTLNFLTSYISFSSDLAKGQSNSIYAKSSLLVFNNNKISTMTIDFNSLDSSLNNSDIYLTGKSLLEFSGREINIKGKIVLEKSSIKSYSEKIEITSLTISNDSVFSMSNIDKLQKTKLSYLNISGIVNLGVDLSSLQSDAIESESIIITPGGLLLIEANYSANASGIISAVFRRLYTSTTFRFNDYDSMLLGDKGGRIDYNPIYALNGQSIDLRINGTLILQDIYGLNDYQKEMAKILDKVNPIDEPQMNKIAKPTFEIMAEGDLDAVKRILSDLSGEFLTKVISVNMFKDRDLLIYSNIENNGDTLWGGLYFDGGQYSQAFNKTASGIRIGINYMQANNFLSGLYLIYEHNNLSMNLNKATINDLETGLYLSATNSNKSLIFKSHIGIDFQFTDITRKIYQIGLSPKSDFNMKTLTAGANLQSKIGIFNIFTDAQYALRFAVDINEDDGGYADLIINSKDIHLFVLKAGAGIENNISEQTDISFKLYAGFVPFGMASEYKIYFANYQNTVNTFINNEKNIFAGAGSSIKYSINDNLSTSFNIDFKIYENSSMEYYASFGVSAYIMGQKTNGKESRKEKKLNYENRKVVFENMSDSKMSVQTKDQENYKDRPIVSADFNKTDNDKNEKQYLNAKSKIYRLSGEAFKKGGYTLSVSAKNKIKELSIFLKQRQYSKIIIEGHTDKSENLKGLSTRRSMAVKNELILNNIPKMKIEVVGYSDTDPLENTNYEESQIINRRTDIIIE